MKSGTVSIGGTFATFGSASGELEQTFATTPGITYIVQFVAEITGTEGQYLEGGILGSPDTLASWSTTSTTFVTQDYAFIANSHTTTIYFYGYGAYLDLAKTSVAEGSFTQPGKYAGSVVVTKSLPVPGISASHTESVVAQINASGGIYAITEPSGSVLIGSFASDSSFVYDGATIPATLNGSNLTFSVSESSTTSDANESTPVTATDTISLTFQ